MGHLPVGGALFLVSALLGGEMTSESSGAPALVRGVILDESGEGLPGCAVGLEGREGRSRTAHNGSFAIVLHSDVAVAEATLVVACPGRPAITVELDSAQLEDFELRVPPPFPSGHFSDRVEVVEQLSETGAPRELAAHEAPVAISSSVAEALDASSGAVVLRTLGVADRISLRGAEPRLVAIRIGGEALPAIEGEERVAGLSTLPLELFDSIAVATSFLSDSDADAIGGVIDLRTASPSDEPKLDVFGTVGKQDLEGSTLSAGARIGGRGADDLGWHLGALVRSGKRGAHVRQQRWEGDSQERNDLRAHQFNGELTAVVGGVTLDLTPSTRLRGDGLTNHTRGLELRWRTKYDYADGEIEREVKDAEVLTRINRFALGVDHLVSASTSAAASLVFSGSLRSEPERADTSFQLDEVEYDASLQPLNESLDRFALDKIGVENNRANDETWALTADLTSVRSPWNALGQWKLGGKLRSKSRSQDYNTTLLESESFLPLSGYVGPDDLSLFRGQHSLGWVVDADEATSLLSDERLEGTRSLAEDAGDFDADEGSWSAYLQGRIEPAIRAHLIAGLRWEGAAADYRGYVLEPVVGDSDLALLPSSGTWNEQTLLPAVLLVTEVSDHLRISAGVSRSFARPDFYDIVPYELIDLDDSEIERGNPSLRSTRSWNQDLGLSWRPSPSFRVRGSLFNKALTQIIFQTTRELDVEGEAFDVTSLANGERGALSGLELDLEASPSPLRGLRIRFSGTLTDSRADLEGRGTQRLPGQAAHSLYLQLSYGRGRWSLAAQGKQVGALLWEVGEDEASDVWRDPTTWLDLSARYEFGERLSLALDLRNLTDERDRLSANGRLRSEELGGRTIGLSFRIRP